MLLPYASEFVPNRNRPAWATWALITLLSAFALLVTANDRLQIAWAGKALLFQWGISTNQLKPHTLFTYLFLHESLAHLLLNLFYLWLFGTAVEAAIGAKRFLAFFALAGVFGGFLQWLVTATLLPPEASYTPIVGASAACAGMVGLFAVRYYRAKLAFIGIPFRPHVVTVISLFLLYESISGVWRILGGGVTDGVAHWAHIGGFVLGLGYAHIMKLDEAGRNAYLQDDASQAMNANLPGEAIRRWEMILTKEPNNATARRELARSWLLLGDNEQATLHFIQAIRSRLRQKQRSEAALLHVEMAQSNLREGTDEASKLTAQEIFSLGCALEDLEQWEPAASLLQNLTTRHPNAPEAEAALLKVGQIYAQRLKRTEEGKIFLRLFLERYPQSQWRHYAEEIQRRLNADATKKGTPE